MYVGGGGGGGREQLSLTIILQLRRQGQKRREVGWELRWGRKCPDDMKARVENHWEQLYEFPYRNKYLLQL